MTGDLFKTIFYAFQSFFAPIIFRQVEIYGNAVAEAVACQATMRRARGSDTPDCPLLGSPSLNGYSQKLKFVVKDQI